MKRPQINILWQPNMSCIVCRNSIDEEDFVYETVEWNGLIFYVHLHIDCVGSEDYDLERTILTIIG